MESTKFPFRIIYFALVFILLTSTMSAIYADTPKAEGLFQKMIQAYKTVDFQGKFTLILRHPMGNQSLEIIEIRKAPDKRRIDIISPPTLAGLGFAVDGERNWQIGDFGHRRLPFHLLLPDQLEDNQFYNFRILLKNYKIQIFNGGSVAERDTYLIDITPKSQNRPSRKVWIDSGTGIPLKVELYDIQKSLVKLIVYSKINFNPNISEDLFKEPHRPWNVRRPPPGPRFEKLWDQSKGKLDINEIKNKTQFGITVIEQLPGGFALQSINFVKFGKDGNVHLRYSDGLAVLSVFQSQSEEPQKPRKPDGKQPPPPPLDPDKVEKINIKGLICDIIIRGPSKIIRWRQGNLYYTVIGESDKKEMIKIASLFIK